TGRWTPHHWARGGCLYGILPCNGLIYTPPHNCACYLEAKLFGFNALAPQRVGSAERASSVEGRVTGENRLLRGPAFGVPLVTRHLPPGTGPKAAWPTYRHDNRRSGCASTALGGTLRERWRVRFPARASQPTIAGGRALVAVPDLHAVVCLQAATGEERWRFTADGRVDSPPAIFGGFCAFGSADGHVYCLAMDTGKLAWRFRAAPNDRCIMAFGQIENAVPVPGSVLVRDGEAIFVAGRSVFLDGGLKMIRLDGRTGRLLSEHVMDDTDPERPGRGFQYRLKGLSMPVGLPDVLSCDERNIYMRSQRFDLEGKRRSLAPVPATAGDGGRHIFSPTGFLDASWMHRSYWVYGTGFDEGAGGWSKAGKVTPAGRILCHDSESVYGYGRKSTYYRWSTPLEYRLFAATRDPAGKKGKSRSRVTYRWSRETQLHVTSMLVAGDRLFVAGPPSVVNEAAAFTDPLDERVRAKLKDQTAAFRGDKGGLLEIVAVDSGEGIAEMTLDYLPAFDGMAAAEEKLFLASRDGLLVCYGGRWRRNAATVPGMRGMTSGGRLPSQAEICGD
ncbi:MAG: outer membrane protein assembly factor BamB family protein, partial [Planctomycetota bacterium]